MKIELFGLSLTLSEFEPVNVVLEQRLADVLYNKTPYYMFGCPDESIIPEPIVMHLLANGYIEYVDDFGNIRITEKFLDEKGEYLDALLEFKTYYRTDNVPHLYKTIYERSY